MRKLVNDRVEHPSADPLDLPGDLVMPAADEAWALRPFADQFPVTFAAGNGAVAEEGPRERAAALASLGRRLDAILVLRQLLGESPRDTLARLDLARYLHDSGDTDDALEELERAEQTPGAGVDVLVTRAVFLVRLGQAAKAEEILRGVLHQMPDHAEAAFQLGVALLRRGKVRDAVIQLRQVVAREPGHPEALFLIAEGLASLRDDAEALSAFEQAGRASPHDPRIWQHMGRLLDRMGRTEEAMKMYRRAREVATP